MLTLIMLPYTKAICDRVHTARLECLDNLPCNYSVDKATQRSYSSESES